jgi:hypothetical protein
MPAKIRRPELKIHVQVLVAVSITRPPITVLLVAACSSYCGSEMAWCHYRMLINLGSGFPCYRILGGSSTLPEGDEIGADAIRKKSWERIYSSPPSARVNVSVK